MDSSKLDELPRALATSTSRRGTIKVLFTSVLGGALGLGGIGITQAALVDPCKKIIGDQCTGICGSTNDKDPLWCIAQRCIHGKRKCFEVDPGGEWVLNRPGSNNYTLIAGQRVTGIECHKIWDSTTPDYWEFAWQAAQRHLLPKHLPVGMAINAANARNYCQLHIHISCIQTGVLNTLTANDSTVPTNPSNWTHTILTLGTPPNQYQYRVLHLNTLQPGGKNLFQLLKDIVGPSAMRYQTLVVVARPKSLGGGFYILNSATHDPNLPNGNGHGEVLLNETC